MNNENMAVYPPYRLVAQFADGARLLFDGLTEAQAQQSMEAAQAQHGDIAWYDGVTNLHYENFQSSTLSGRSVLSNSITHTSGFAFQPSV